MRKDLVEERTWWLTVYCEKENEVVVRSDVPSVVQPNGACHQTRIR